MDGHDVDAVCHALKDMKASRSDGPKALIANTIKGRGVPGLENAPLCHIMNPKAETLDQLLGEAP